MFEKWRFYTPRIWGITPKNPKNEGCGFPWWKVWIRCSSKILNKSQKTMDVGSGFKHQDFFDETFLAVRSHQHGFIDVFFFVGNFRIIKRTRNPKPGGQNPTMSAKQTQFVGLWVLGRCEQHESPPMNVNLVIHGGIWIILLTQYEQVQSWVIGESLLPKIVGKKSKNIFEFSPRVPISKGIRFQAPHSQDQLTAR